MNTLDGLKLTPCTQSIVNLHRRMNSNLENIVVDGINYVDIGFIDNSSTEAFYRSIVQQKPYISNLSVNSLLSNWIKVTDALMEENSERIFGEWNDYTYWTNRPYRYSGYTTSIATANADIINQSNDRHYNHKLYKMRDISELSTQKTVQPVFYYMNIIDDKEDAYAGTLGTYGIILHNFRLILILSNDIGTRNQQFTSTPSADELSYSHGIINNSDGDATVSQELTTSRLEKLSNTITHIENYRKETLLKTELTVTLEKLFAKAQLKAEASIDIVEAFENGWTTTTEVTKQSKSTSAISKTLPPFSQIILNQKSGKGTVSISYEYPIAVAYDVIFVMYLPESECYGTNVSKIVTEYKGDTLRGTTDGRSDLCKRAKGIVIEPTNLQYQNTNLKNAISEICDYVPMSEAGAKVSYDQFVTTSEVNAVYPIDPLTTIRPVDRVTEYKISKNHPLYLSSILLEGRNSKSGPFAGFKQENGYWQLLDQNGSLVPSGENDVARLGNTATGVFSLIAKSDGLVFLRYMIEENVYLTADNATLSDTDPNKKWITNDDVTNKALIQVTVSVLDVASIKAQGTVVGYVDDPCVNLDQCKTLSATVYDSTGREVNTGVTWVAQELPSKGVSIANNCISFTLPGIFHIRAECGGKYSNWIEVTGKKARKLTHILIADDRYISVILRDSIIQDITKTVDLSQLTVSGMDADENPYSLNMNEVVWLCDRNEGVVIEQTIATISMEGTYSFYAMVGDVRSNSLTMNVYSAPVITSPENLIQATMGVEYSTKLTALGAAPITWSLREDELQWFSLDSDGSITGIPNSLGTFSFVATALNQYGNQASSFSIEVVKRPVDVPVADIVGMFSNYGINEEIKNLGATVLPENATYKEILWLIVDDGGTGAEVVGSRFHAKQAGTVTIMALIEDGIAENIPYTKEFTIEVTEVDREYISVVSIQGIPSRITKNDPMPLRSVVTPSDATKQSILWLILDDGKTGAKISDNQLRTSNRGIVQLQATIQDAVKLQEKTQNYQQLFQITVADGENTYADVYLPEIPTIITKQKDQNTIQMEVPMSVDLTKLAPVVVPESAYATVYPPNGTIRDFTEPAEFIILAEDQSCEEYTLVLKKQTEYVPVGDIVGVPSVIKVGISVILTAKAIAANNSPVEVLEANDLSDKTEEGIPSYFSIQWSIGAYGDTVAEVNDNVLTVTQVGTVELIATIENGASMGTPYVKRFLIESYANAEDVTDILLSSSKMILGVGQIAKIDYQLVPKGANTRVQYHINNERKVRLTDDNKLLALEEGGAVLTITTENNTSASCDIYVIPAPTDVKISQSKAYLGVGEQLQLQAVTSSYLGDDLEFYSSDPEIASVDMTSGIVTAKHIGKTDITVTTYNGIYDSCQLEVFEAPTMIRLSEDYVILDLGEKYELRLQLSDNSYGTVYYCSSNEAVAMLDDNGFIHGVGLGDAKVKVWTYNNIEIELQVHVVPVLNEV